MTFEEERSLGFLERVNFRGVTHLGRELDPFTDKLRFLGVLLMLGPEIVWTWLIVLCCVFALGTTVVRPIKRYFGLGDASANGAGKYKVAIEFLGLALLVFLPKDILCLEGMRIAVNSVFTLALLMAAASLFGHLYNAFQKMQKRCS